MYKYIIMVLLVSSIISCTNNDKQPVVEKTKSCCEKSDEKTLSKDREVDMSESLFSLTDSFVTQDKVPFTLSMLNGKPTVVGMIFTHCAYACPRLTSDMLGVADKLKDVDVNYLLVSFDIKRDNPDRLKVYAKNMELPDSWILLKGNESAVRTLSVLLNVQYEELADGGFNHSNVISVLDKNGILKYQVEGLEANHTKTISTIRSIIAQ